MRKAIETAIRIVPEGVFHEHWHRRKSALSVTRQEMPTVVNIAKEDLVDVNMIVQKKPFVLPAFYKNGKTKQGKSRRCYHTEIE